MQMSIVSSVLDWAAIIGTPHYTPDGKVDYVTPFLGEDYRNWRIKRLEEKEAEAKAEAERQRRAAEAEAERKERWDNIARTDNSLMDRYETLERLTPKGGTLAVIRRYYDSYCSEWQYVMRHDGSLIRTRGQDRATVEFESMSDLLDDYGGYRHHGFELSY